jgi:hypothetical protein
MESLMPSSSALLERGFRPYRKSTVTYAKQMDRRFSVRFDNGEVLRGKPGDYACVSPDDGGKWIVARDIFKDTYAPVKIKPAQQTGIHARLLNSGFRPFGKNQVTWAKKVSKPIRLHTLEGDIIAQPGDYLCIGSKGEPWPQKADRFEAHYKPLPLPARSK